MVKVELRFSYCLSISGVLKWVQMMVSAVVVGLVLWEVVKTRDTESSHLFDGETFTCVTGVFTFVVVFMLLIVYFCNCHNDCACKCQCRLIATVVYTLLVIMWIAAAGVEVWLSVDIKQQKTEGILTEKEITKHQYNRRPAAAAFCFINIICCGASLYLAKFKDK